MQVGDYGQLEQLTIDAHRSSQAAETSRIRRSTSWSTEAGSLVDAKDGGFPGWCMIGSAYSRNDDAPHAADWRTGVGTSRKGSLTRSWRPVSEPISMYGRQNSTRSLFPSLICMRC